ncbi:hypothetical protein EPI10_027341 [Gossypium australe]|uniref:Uncharacterized protein n=1 Tax=Gossypium australe TaxID=47621 RepID=A0A5B6UVP7_9ROSI|nr:hypothetical protein EPI10_027341 [Gossypium australe]
MERGGNTRPATSSGERNHNTFHQRLESPVYQPYVGERYEKLLGHSNVRRIDVGESTKRLAPRKKENEVNNVGSYNKGYSKPITVGPSKTITTSLHAPPKQESNQRPNTERLQFTPIPMTYRELYQNLFDTHVVSPFYLKPMQPPFPKWYDALA